MTKTKAFKPFTVATPTHKVTYRILDLEDKLRNRHTLDLDSNPIKAELRELYRLRHKQKNYTPPPPSKKNLKKGL